MGMPPEIKAWACLQRLSEINLQWKVASFVNTEWKYKYVELSFYIEGSINITIYIYIPFLLCYTCTLCEPNGDIML
jgi:hypothetical protein